MLSENTTCSDVNDGNIFIENNSMAGFETTVTDSEGNQLSNTTNNQLVDSVINLPEGIYYVEVSDVVCGSQTDTLTISAPPIISSGYNYTSNGLEVTFHNQSVNGISYLWDFGDGNTSDDLDPVHEYTGEGTYYVTLTVYQNETCFETYSEWMTILTTGVEDIVQQAVKVWVNEQQLNIQNPGFQFKNYQVKNVLGQELRTGNFNNRAFEKVDLTGLSTQVLVVTLTNDTEAQTIKIAYTSLK